LKRASKPSVDGSFATYLITPPSELGKGNTYIYPSVDAGGDLYAAVASFKKNGVDAELWVGKSTDDGGSFTPWGDQVKLRFSWWKGARPALFSFNTGEGEPGYADFDWVHVSVTPAPPAP